MKFWVGVTDKNWFEYLASINPDEVNFWKLGGQGFDAIELGYPFLFKLCNYINILFLLKLIKGCKNNVFTLKAKLLQNKNSNGI